MRGLARGWPTADFVATFSSPEQKDKWHSLLQRCINLEMEKDYPKSTPLKILTKGVGNCVCSKPVAIRDSGTAKEVITTSLPALG